MNTIKQYLVVSDWWSRDI